MIMTMATSNYSPQRTASFNNEFCDVAPKKEQEEIKSQELINNASSAKQQSVCSSTPDWPHESRKKILNSRLHISENQCKIIKSNYDKIAIKLTEKLVELEEFKQNENHVKLPSAKLKNSKSSQPKYDKHNKPGKKTSINKKKNCKYESIQNNIRRIKKTPKSNANLIDKFIEKKKGHKSQVHSRHFTPMMSFNKENSPIDEKEAHKSEERKSISQVKEMQNPIIKNITEKYIKYKEVMKTKKHFKNNFNIKNKSKFIDRKTSKSALDNQNTKRSKSCFDKRPHKANKVKIILNKMK